MAKPAKDIAVESAEEWWEDALADAEKAQEAAADREPSDENIEGGASKKGGATKGAKGAKAADAADEPEGEAAEADEAEVLEAEVIEDADEAADDAADEAADADADAEAAEPTNDELVKKAQEQAAEWQGKYLRLHAEWDTYRRRKTEQAAAEKARATEKLVEDLIPVIDDFERTIDYAAKNGEEGLLGGVEAVLKKFLDVLGRSGVEIIDPAGEEYNALEAQAVATVPDESVPEETVADVYQKGYKMGSKVLRSAMVTVTTGGPKREKPAEEQE